MKKSFNKFACLLLMLFIFAFVSTAPAKAKEAAGGYSIENSYKRVSRSLEKVRSLRFKKTIPYSIKDKAFLRSFLMRELKAELPDEKFNAFDLSLKQFGFLPKNFKTWDFLLNLYTSEVAGLYDYKTGQLMLMGEQTKIPGAEQLQQYGVSVGDVLLIHEMEHGIQDQYFNLTKMLTDVKRYKSDDSENAALALIEGDATLVMMNYMLETLGQSFGMDMGSMVDMSQMKDMMTDMPMSGAGASTLQSAPLYFKRTMLFSYMDGMVFVDALKKRGGWNEVNKAFRYPPRSTEQIMHPQRYFMKDEPVVIDWTKLPKTLGDWKMMSENTCGEMIIKTMFENLLPDSDYRSIADGWGGDRYRIYKNGDNTFLVWFSVWDRKQDARQFMRYYLEVLKKKYPAVKWTQTVPGKAYLGKVDEDYVYLAINGEDVLVLESVPGKYAKQVMTEGWLVNQKKMK